ncbi:hypothetical protein TUN199_02070 [Pyrenophora tritici-repentis]|uniref:Rhodopsin domain-containing protein n=1 Tax=Pyrenophora tritici-repentis TaxID=45151 RepID=A0A2W1H7W3_9PLEO|nr:hypothetical protein Alg130_07505 [Pyrenophora tritici-repentis]KAI0605336.1 hypothetical protein TUN205_10409 [Pyrenophora tritici-repentis]KAI0625886.1 hypothetical protein TUN199_02070 [Pyrenophora tritici-repentis]KAI1513513.1 hypothetical protein Ptr86124_007415 [Pyrenophora tritici-repentis]KAI1544784.1 hypothetical protein PtrSN001A_002576 [Pyrenophora tritici-repentis]
MTTDELSDVAWDKTKVPATMGRGHLDRVNSFMLALTSIVFLARVATRITKHKKFELQDFFCCLSYVCYVAMVVMYFNENGPLYRAESVQRGEIAPYPDIPLVLFLSYFSKAVALGTSYIGSSMTTIFVCDSNKAKYGQGVCAKPHEQKRAQFSLWFAYAVDVATDLAVMFLPFRMTWNLRLPRSQKFGIFVLFGSGWICILFATLRVVQVSVKDGVPMIPDPKWLEMWTVIETSMAVMIGCAPAFNALRSRRNNNRVRKPVISLEMQSSEGRSTEQLKHKEELVFITTHENVEIADLTTRPELV